MCRDNISEKYVHICEVCGKYEILTCDGAFNAEQDYPSQTGQFKVVSPRICGNSSISDTLWWELNMEKKVKMNIVKNSWKH